ncbi:MAG TPA: hypothetical protein DEA08_04815 [Planctomycetes bacterium]|nr:hypothetical protein [Planctomycetota bacterium]
MSERSGRLGRIFTYLNAQFPPAVMLPSGVATFLALHWSLQALAGQEPLVFGARAIVGALTITLFMAILRVYDELKDAESDRRLAAAGDPRYMDRPIVTGEITEGDLHVLRHTITALMLLMNLPLLLLGKWFYPALGFAAAYLATWLSFKWYFWPKIKTSLLLALLTHNPLTVVLQAYVLTLFLQEFTLAGPRWGLALICFGMWFPITAWETCRKIRLPDMETDYETYSKVFGGWRRAAVVPAFLILVSAGCVLALSRQIGLGPVFWGVLGVAALVPVGAVLRLQLQPTPAATKLRPFVEVYVVVAQAGLAIALGVTRGVTWRPW